MIKYLFTVISFVFVVPYIYAGPGEKFLKLGEEEFSKGNYVNSILYMRRLVKLQPYSSKAHYLLGKYLLYRNDIKMVQFPNQRKSNFRNYKEAAKYIYKSLVMENLINPTNEQLVEDLWFIASRHFDLAMAYWFSGNIDRALTHFRYCINIEFRFLQAYYNMASIYESRNQMVKANCFFRLYLREKYSLEMEKQGYDVQVDTHDFGAAARLKCYK